MMAKERNTSSNIEDVVEICGYVTTKEAAKIVGLEWPTMSQVVYDRKVAAVRIGGIILVEKASCERYRQEREQMLAEEERKRKEREAEKAKEERDKALRLRLATLNPEQLEALLAKIEVEAQ